MSWASDCGSHPYRRGQGRWIGLAVEDQPVPRGSGGQALREIGNSDRSYEYKIVSRDGVAAKVTRQDRTIRLYRFGGGLDGVGDELDQKTAVE